MGWNDEAVREAMIRILTATGADQPIGRLLMMATIEEALSEVDAVDLIRRLAGFTYGLLDQLAPVAGVSSEELVRIHAIQTLE